MKNTQEVRDSATMQNSDSYLASENIKRDTLAEDAEEARERMEIMGKAYREKGNGCICLRARAGGFRTLRLRCPRPR